MSRLGWSIPPNRFAGHRTLPNLPGEIYLEIFGYLKKPYTPGIEWTTYDLRGVARCCRYFYILMIPWIYEVVIFGDESGWYEAGLGVSFCRRVCDENEAALAAASHVKTIRLFDPDGEGSEYLFQLCAVAIFAMDNLVEISLQGVTITNALLRAIVTRRNLKRFTLDGLNRRVQEWSKHLLEQLSRVELETLHLGTGFYRPPPADKPLPEVLINLPFRKITTLHCLDAPISRIIRTSPPLLSLQTFHATSLRIEDDLPRLLCKMPNLQHLKVEFFDSFISDNTVWDNLPTLPHLREICAPMGIIDKLLPESRVFAVEISYQTHRTLAIPSKEELQLLSTSPRPITKLKVPLCFYTITDFSKLFPALCYLILEPSHSNYTSPWEVWDDSSLERPLSYLLDSWPSHPPLHELTLVMGSGYDEPFSLSPSIQQRLSSAIPTLRCFSVQYSDPEEVETVICYDTWYRSSCSTSKAWLKCSVNGLRK